MRKYISVRLESDFEGNQDVNINVLSGPEALVPGVGMACGWIEDGDLEDLETPARLMVNGLLGREDEELTEKLQDAFEEILSRRPIGVKINY